MFISNLIIIIQVLTGSAESKVFQVDNSTTKFLLRLIPKENNKRRRPLLRKYEYLCRYIYIIQ